MKLEIIRGAAGSGKTTKLQEILRNAGDKGDQAHIWGHASLVVERKLRRMAADGITTIAIDDCAREDLEMLQIICNTSDAEGVTIYAVEAA